jgi:hypothetical protein
MNAAGRAPVHAVVDPALAAEGERWLAGLFGSSAEYMRLERAAEPALRHGVGLPFAMDAGKLWELVASDTLDIAAHEFRLVRTTAGQDAELPVHLYGRALGTRVVPRAAAVRDLYQQGATLAFQRLDRKFGTFAGYCAALSARLGHPLQLSAYLSPPHAQGLDVHHDTHDVVVIQLEGEKRFDLYEPVVASPVPGLLLRRDQAARARHVGSCALAPGDVLYLPRGVPHRALSGARHSLHLTLGVLAVNWSVLVEDLVRELRFIEPLRASCAAGELFDAAALHAGAARAAVEIGAWLQAHGADRLAALACERYAASFAARPHAGDSAPPP